MGAELEVKSLQAPATFVHDADSLYVDVRCSLGLRGAGDTRTPMKVNIMISVLNFVLNLILCTFLEYQLWAY